MDQLVVDPLYRPQEKQFQQLSALPGIAKEIDRKNVQRTIKPLDQVVVFRGHTPSHCLHFLGDTHLPPLRIETFFPYWILYFGRLTDLAEGSMIYSNLEFRATNVNVIRC